MLGYLSFMTSSSRCSEVSGKKSMSCLSGDNTLHPYLMLAISFCLDGNDFSTSIPLHISEPLMIKGVVQVQSIFAELTIDLTHGPWMWDQPLILLQPFQLCGDDCAFGIVQRVCVTFTCILSPCPTATLIYGPLLKEGTAMQSCIFKRIIPLKTYKNKMFIFATADFSNADLSLYFIFISEKKLKLALSCTLVKWNQYFSC